MATPTVQDFDDGLTDLNNLDDFMNTATSGTVTLRNGNTIDNLARLIALTAGIGDRDLNGLALVLDVDGDTSIVSDFDDRIRFIAAGSEVARYDSGQAEWLFALTSDNGVNTGHVFSDNGFFRHVRDSGVVGVINRGVDDGSIVSFRQDNTQIGSIGCDGTTFELESSLGDLSLIADSSNSILFTRGTTESARITGAGSFLVGKNLLDTNTAGGRIDPDGLGVFSRDSNQPLLVNRITDDGTIISLRQDNSQEGSISISGATTSYNTSSDRRLKTTIKTMTGGLVRLNSLRAVTFEMKKNRGAILDGFIADEVQEIVPMAVTGEKDAVDEDGNPEYQQMDAAKLIPLMVASIQELAAKVEALEAR